jgi:uncharacterized protein involved in exopolysaccharide biosynthesis
MSEVQRPASTEARSEPGPLRSEEQPVTPDAAWLDEPIDLGQYVRRASRRPGLLAVGALAGALAAFVLASIRPVLYEAVTTMLVVSASGSDAPANVMSYRALVENLTIAAEVIEELALDQPPSRLTPQRFLHEAVVVDDLRGRSVQELRFPIVLRLKVRLNDPEKAAEAGRLLARRAIALNEEITRRDASMRRGDLKAHLQDAAKRLQAAEQELVTYHNATQLDLVAKDVDAALEERGGLLKLLIEIEAEKARLAAVEAELARQEPVLSVGRAVEAEEALRRASRPEDDQEEVSGLDLSNPFVNPVYQTLEYQVAINRSKVAALEGERRELIDVRKLDGDNLKELANLYRSKIELRGLESSYELAEKVHADIALRYEQAVTVTLGSGVLMQIIDEGRIPDRPLPRGRLRWTAVGLVCGLMLGAVVALARPGHGRAAPSNLRGTASHGLG